MGGLKILCFIPDESTLPKKTCREGLAQVHGKWRQYKAIPPNHIFLPILFCMFLNSIQHSSNTLLARRDVRVEYKKERNPWKKSGPVKCSSALGSCKRLSKVEDVI